MLQQDGLTHSSDFFLGRSASLRLPQAPTPPPAPGPNFWGSARESKSNVMYSATADTPSRSPRKKADLVDFIHSLVEYLCLAIWNPTARNGDIPKTIKKPAANASSDNANTFKSRRINVYRKRVGSSSPIG